MKHRNYPQASKEQQAQWLREGTPESLDLLAQSVMPWAVTLVQRYSSTYFLDDMECESCAGMAITTALKKWQPEISSLTNYLVFHVRTQVAVTVSEKNTIHVPANFCKSKKFRRHHPHKLLAYKATQHTDIYNTEDSFIDPSAHNPQDTTECADTHNRVRQALTELPPLMGFVLYERFYRSATLKTVAHKLNTDKRHIRQIEDHALARMADILEGQV